MERMRSPAVPEDPPAVLHDSERWALLKICEGADFAEVANLKMDNVDLDVQTGGPLILEVAYYK